MTTVVKLTEDETRHLLDIHREWLRKSLHIHGVSTFKDLANITPTYRDVYLPLLDKLSGF